MDESLGQDPERKLSILTETPDLDPHVRIQEHQLEGYVWPNGRRYRFLGVRDGQDAEVPADDGDCP